MTIDNQGKIDIGYKELGKLVLAMMLGATVPVCGAMVIMYGDKRVIESTQSAHGVIIERHSERLEKHDSRITTLEARVNVEE